jgi:hypothetical protein
VFDILKLFLKQKIKGIHFSNICGENNFMKVIKFKKMFDQRNIEVALRYGIALENEDFGKKHLRNNETF